MNWKFKKIKRQKETEIGRGKHVKTAKKEYIILKYWEIKEKLSRATEQKELY